jgi:hypothetical protein
MSDYTYLGQLPQIEPDRSSWSGRPGSQKFYTVPIVRAGGVEIWLNDFTNGPGGCQQAVIGPGKPVHFYEAGGEVYAYLQMYDHDHPDTFPARPEWQRLGWRYGERLTPEHGAAVLHALDAPAR